MNQPSSSNKQHVPDTDTCFSTSHLTLCCQVVFELICITSLGSGDESHASGTVVWIQDPHVSAQPGRTLVAVASRVHSAGVACREDPTSRHHQAHVSQICGCVQGTPQARSAIDHSLLCTTAGRTQLRSCTISPAERRSSRRSSGSRSCRGMQALTSVRAAMCSLAPPKQHFQGCHV